ncbi:MAG: hypothetical protein ABEJ61_08525 [Haloferacaceae archaeon]
MTLRFEVGERFREAATELGDRRMMDPESAMELKAEQALLEIEHLVADATEVEFEIEGWTVRHEPSDDLAAFLAEQADATGIEESTLLKLHVELFARVFLDDEGARPPNAPPE